MATRGKGRPVGGVRGATRPGSGVDAAVGANRRGSTRVFLRQGGPSDGREETAVSISGEGRGKMVIVTEI